jgi:hypothetical protein
MGEENEKPIWRRSIEGASWCLVGISYIFSDTTYNINVNAIDMSSSFNYFLFGMLSFF